MKETSESTHQNDTLEQQEFAHLVEKPKPLARILSVLDRLSTLVQDQKVREMGGASVRTIANIAVSAADIFPGIGEASELGADALKLLSKVAKSAGITLPTDLTPDVPMSVTLGANAANLVPFVPGHLVEGLYQFFHKDKDRIAEGLVQTLKILKGDIQAEQKDFQTHAKDLLPAMKAFGVIATAPETKSVMQKTKNWWADRKKEQ